MRIAPYILAIALVVSTIALGDFQYTMPKWVDAPGYNPDGTPRKSPLDGLPGPTPAPAKIATPEAPKKNDATDLSKTVDNIVNRLTGAPPKSPPLNTIKGFGYDEGEKKEFGDKKPRKGPPEDNGYDGQPPQALPYYLPFCFLADPSFPEATVNTQIKTVVDNYAKCGIAVDVFTATIRPNYPADPQGLQAAARRQCNFSQNFGTRGSIMVMTQYGNQPSQMCRDPGATGCSTLCERLSVQMLAPGTTANTALHESLHGNCCGRLCVNAGEGTTDVGVGIQLVEKNELVVKQFWAEEGANIQDANLNRAVCPSLVAGAAQNNGTRLWDPTRARYYQRQTDEARMWDIMGNQQFVTRPLAGAPGIPENNDKPGGGGGGGGPLPPGKAVPVVEVDQGFAHRTKHPGAVNPASALLTALSRPANPPPAQNAVPPSRVTTSRGYGYDESATKDGSGGGGSKISGKSTPNSDTPPDIPASRGYGYDESATKELADAGPSIPKGKYGYDESASKEPGGGNAGSALKNKLAFGGGGGTALDSDVPEASGKGGGYAKRKRGEALKRKGSATKGRGMGLPRQSDALISTRPEPDFQVDGNQQDAGVY